MTQVMINVFCLEIIIDLPHSCQRNKIKSIIKYSGSCVHI